MDNKKVTLFLIKFKSLFVQRWLALWGQVPHLHFKWHANDGLTNTDLSPGLFGNVLITIFICKSAMRRAHMLEPLPLKWGVYVFSRCLTICQWVY